MIVINRADIVVGLAWGDEAKGKITSQLASKKNADGSSFYSLVARWAGGNNAGHTVYVEGKKYKTHLVPSGVFHGIPSLVGPACVLHPKSFYKELTYLSESGFDTSLVKVSPKCHIVKDEFLQFDKDNLAKKFGTTSRGIAPCYAAKAARTGLLAKDVLSSNFIWDERLEGNLLCEGAQGVWLDLDQGNYPYVTSSTTLPYGACSIGFPSQMIGEVWGAAKLYDTRSGEDPMFPSSLFDDLELTEVGRVGQEYGVTTGRRRKVNWLNLDYLCKAVRVTGTTDLVISKCDVLEDLGTYKAYHNGSLIVFGSIDEMKSYVYGAVKDCSNLIRKIIFSSSPEGI
jgi:adenylosuccinate synthase